MLVNKIYKLHILYQTMFIFLLIIAFIIFFYYKKSHQVEHFSLLNGITKPLTTTDDYATKSYLFNFNDLPLYDSTYNDMAYIKPNGTIDYCNPNNTFISNCKIKRLIPQNYTDYETTYSTNLDDNTKSTIPIAPLPINYFY